MTNNILLKFAKKGINLSPDAYKKVMSQDNPVNFASDLIVKLKSRDFKPADLISVDGEVIDEITGNKSKSNDDTTKDSQEVSTDSISKKSELKIEDKKTESEGIVKIEDSEKVVDAKVQFKRNLEKSNVTYDYEVIQDSSNKSYTSGEIGDLITYFQSRYEKLHKILKQRPDLKMTTKVADIDDGQTTLNLILMVREIRSTKNGHKFVEF